MLEILEHNGLDSRVAHSRVRRCVTEICTVSSLATLLTVSLKSPHILTLPFSFTTGTMGAAQSENGMGSMTPAFCKWSSSCSTRSLSEKGIERKIQKQG